MASFKKTWSDFVLSISIPLFSMDQNNITNLLIWNLSSCPLALLKWSEYVLSARIKCGTLLLHVIIPVEWVNQFVQCDVLHGGFVLAPAIDRPSLCKCNVVKLYQIISKRAVVSIWKCTTLCAWTLGRTLFEFYFIIFSFSFPTYTPSLPFYLPHIYNDISGHKWDLLL